MLCPFPALTMLPFFLLSGRYFLKPAVASHPTKTGNNSGNKLGTEHPETGPNTE
jgi:hypothetical protein